MSEELDVMWRGVRAWLDSVRRASAEIEPLVREIRALEDARDEMLGWRTKAGGSGAHSAGAHSDPTATVAEQRMCELDDLILARRGEWKRRVALVGACGEVLDDMGEAIGEKHMQALELYYVDCADTWSEVACEMRISRTRLWQMRIESYAWIDTHCRNVLRE